MGEVLIGVEGAQLVSQAHVQVALAEGGSGNQRRHLGNGGDRKGLE